MLEPIRHILSRQVNILASGSPRRKEILASVGLNFDVIPSQFQENLDKDSFSHPCEYVKETAKQKAIEVWRRLASQTSRVDLVIGADTVVTLDEQIYEKPTDKEDAFQILTKLSGTKHTVFTGVALITRPSAINSVGDSSSVATRTAPSSTATNDPTDGSGDIFLQSDNQDFVVTTFHEATDVFMTEMSPAIIRGYVGTGEPLDKAGGYGIQGIGGTLIEGIKGDYFNVMGLPLHRLCKELYHMYMD